MADRTMTKGQIRDTCSQAYPLLNAALNLLDPHQPFDAPAIKILLTQAAWHLSSGLKWTFEPSQTDTGISRQSMINLLLPATARVGAVRRLALEIHAQASDETEIDGAWKMLAAALIDIVNILKTDTFRRNLQFGSIYHDLDAE